VWRAARADGPPAACAEVGELRERRKLGRRAVGAGHAARSISLHHGIGSGGVADVNLEWTAQLEVGADLLRHDEDEDIRMLASNLEQPVTRPHAQDACERTWLFGFGFWKT